MGGTWCLITVSILQHLPLVGQCLLDKKVLGGICDASAFLGTAGALNHVRHTCNVIAANGTAPLEFAKEVLRTLKAAPESEITEWFNFHKLGYYDAPMPKDAMEWID